MAEQVRIRWTKKQVAELYRDVRVFNAARTRAIKKAPETASFLPEKLDVKKLKSSIYSRQELKALTVDVDRALKYKFEVMSLSDGTIITRKEFEDAKIKTSIANAVKKRVAKQRGVKLKAPGRMGTEEQFDLTPFRTDLENIPGREWERYMRAVEDRLTEDYYTWEDERYKEQYIEVLWQQLGPGEDTMALVDLIQKIPARRMIQVARENPGYRISYIYPNKGEDVQLVYNQLSFLWGMVE